MNLEITADGNCLFRAMSFFNERGNQENHMKYRREVVNYLRKNKQEYQVIFETEEELEDYIRTLDKDRAWGGELELSILSKLYHCGFTIHAFNRPIITVDSWEDENDESIKVNGEKKQYHLAYHLNVSHS